MKKIEEIIKSYPQSQAALLPVLWQVQEQDGFVSSKRIAEIADLLNISSAEVLSVVSFYTMFQRKPLGKYHIQVCTNLCCRLRGADWLLSYLKQKLKIEVGQTTQDNLFHLSTVECLGSCGTAPMMMINTDYYENLDQLKVDQILQRLE